MIVRETIHHGDYRAVRDVEVQDVSSVGEVGMMLADCTYVTFTAEKAARLAGELSTTGQAEQGWVRWEVLPSCGWGAHDAPAVGTTPNGVPICAECAPLAALGVLS